MESSLQSAVCVCVFVCGVHLMHSDSCHDCFYERIHTHAQPQLPSTLKDVLIKLQLCPAAGAERHREADTEKERERVMPGEGEKGRSKQGSVAVGWWWGTDGRVCVCGVGGGSVSR